LIFAFLLAGLRYQIGPEWIHEVKYDGYLLRVERDGDRVRLITRGGYNWTKRYPWIVEAALKSRHKQFVTNGDAVILGVDRSPISTRSIPQSFPKTESVSYCGCREINESNPGF
jgi:ATP-dependent DNA ligase